MPLRPLAFRDAFDSSIQPDVELPSNKVKRNRTMNTSMEIFGGREPKLHSESEESSEDEETILNTPATTMYNKPKCICALAPTKESIEEHSSKVEFKDHEDCIVEDDNNYEFQQPQIASETQIRSTTRINVLDSEFTSNASLLHEESNDTETPVEEMDRPTSHTSTRSDIERGTSCGIKRQNTSKIQSQPKRMTRHHSKHTHAKEVLLLLVDQQIQQELSPSIRI